MIYGKSRPFVYVRVLIMCKSKDAVIASYHWTVLHTPVDTRAMYYVCSLFPLFVSCTFCYRRGERQDCEKKDCKGDRVGVFQWLARLARLACWLAHWPYSITGRSYIWTKNDERISGYADSTNICIRGSYKEIFISGSSPLPSSTPKKS